MRAVYQKCAGLDVHKKTVVVCIRSHGKQDIRTFRTVTSDLREMATWLMSLEIEAIAMESTGVYWKPVWNVLEELEAKWELLLVNAKHVKQVPGRKTDVKDAEWLAELLRHGLLSPSRVPQRAQRELRDMTRYRRALIQSRAREVQRLQKFLEAANIKLDSVVTDITGASSMAMIKAIISGETDLQKLASLAHRNIKATPDELAQALEGVMGQTHRFLLRVLLENMEHLDGQIRCLDSEIQTQMDNLGAGDNDVDSGAVFDPETGEVLSEPDKGMSWNRAVELLDTIPGINVRAAQDLIVEIGLDMDAFPTSRHLTSWAKISPGNNKSGGKRLSGSTGKGNKWLKTALVEAGWAAVRKKDGYLKAFYARLSGRRGAKRAIVAVARSILEAIYFMLKRNEPYHDLGGQHFDLLQRDRVKNRAIRRLEGLGFQVQLQACEA